MEEIVKRKKHFNRTRMKVSAGRNKQGQVEDESKTKTGKEKKKSTWYCMMASLVRHR